MTPLQHKEGAGFMEGHVYMGGEHTIKWLLPVTPCQMLAYIDVDEEPFLSVYALLIH